MALLSYLNWFRDVKMKYPITLHQSTKGNILFVISTIKPLEGFCRVVNIENFLVSSTIESWIMVWSTTVVLGIPSTYLVSPCGTVKHWQLPRQSSRSWSKSTSINPCRGLRDLPLQYNTDGEVAKAVWNERWQLEGGMVTQFGSKSATRFGKISPFGII